MTMQWEWQCIVCKDLKKDEPAIFFNAALCKACDKKVRGR